jgi:hypothetical protein
MRKKSPNIEKKRPKHMKIEENENDLVKTMDKTPVMKNITLVAVFVVFSCEFSLNMM